MVHLDTPESQFDSPGSHLDTPFVHRILASPVGSLLDNAVFERKKTRSLRREFALQRARVAADVSLAEGPAAYLRAVGAPPAPHLHARIDRALARYAPRREAAARANDRWEEVFWSGHSTVEDRLTAERNRRAAEQRRRDVSDLFGFLVDDHLVPPVAFDVPDPETALSRHHAALADPDSLFAYPTRPPSVERSAWVPGPETLEYWVRFPSPSPFVSDDVIARVYEPLGVRESLPTLIYYGGFGMANDCLDYWPEEAALGRALAPQGVRVVLPDTPWHARREPVAQFSGEAYLARAPESMFQLYAAAAVEAGVLVDWARGEGASSVTLGGISLGGIVTMHAAGRCGMWPASARPDAFLPVAATGDVVSLIRSSTLSSALDLDNTLTAAGWDEQLSTFAPLLNPPSTVGIDPERVFAVGGSEDRLVPFEPFRDTLDAWGVPEKNRFVWDTGHFGVLLRTIRGDLEPLFRTVVANVGPREVLVPDDLPTGESTQELE